MPANSPSPLGVFIVGMLLGDNLGLSFPQQVYWASILNGLGLSPASILLVTEFARRDAAATTSVAVQQATEARQSLAAANARLDELDRRAREDTAQLQQSNAEILKAIRELQNAPPPPPAPPLVGG